MGRAEGTVLDLKCKCFLFGFEGGIFFSLIQTRLNIFYIV